MNQDLPSTHPNTNDIANSSKPDPNEVLRINCVTHKTAQISLLTTDGKKEWKFGRHEKNDVVIDYSQRISKVHFVITMVSLCTLSNAF